MGGNIVWVWYEHNKLSEGHVNTTDKIEFVRYLRKQERPLREKSATTYQYWEHCIRHIVFTGFD